MYNVPAKVAHNLDCEENITITQAAKLIAGDNSDPENLDALTNMFCQQVVEVGPVKIVIGNRHYRVSND